MPEHWCECDPHGDNARCNRECCLPLSSLAQALTGTDIESRAMTRLAKKVNAETRARTLTLIEDLELLRDEVRQLVHGGPRASGT